LSNDQLQRELKAIEKIDQLQRELKAIEKIEGMFQKDKEHTMMDIIRPTSAS